MLGRCGGENAAYLTHQTSFELELAGLVKEIAHLSAHVAEARGCAENDRICFGALLWLGQWNVRKDLTGGFGAHPFQSLVRKQFCHLVELYLCPYVARSGHDGFRHL